MSSDQSSKNQSAQSQSPENHTVEVIICGFSYRLTCKPDQELHLRAMAEKVDHVAQQQAKALPNLSPTRQFLLAALHFADLAHQTADGKSEAEALLTGETASAANAQVLEATQLYLAQVFEELANRLEGAELDLASVANRLPQTPDA